MSWAKVKILQFLELFEDVSAGNVKIKQSEYLSEGTYPIVDQGQSLIGGYSNSQNSICKASLPVVIFGDHTRIVKYIDFPFILGADGVKVLKNKCEADVKYLYYFLKNSKIPDTGYNRHYKFLKELNIPLPPLEIQKKIAAVLEKADELQRKREKQIKRLDDLLQAAFLDMFGDPVTNPKGWPKCQIKGFGAVSTGNTPSRKIPENFTPPHIEWIKTDNIIEKDKYLTKSSEHLSIKGLAVGRVVNEGAILVACIAGSLNSIGRSAIADRQVAFNQQINAIQPRKGIDSNFLYYLFKNSRVHIQDCASSGMKKIITKSVFEKIELICPPYSLQKEFSFFSQCFDEQKARLKQDFQYIHQLFNSLMQRAFKGELELK